MGLWTWGAKNLLLLCAFLLLAVPSFAQDKPPDADKPAAAADNAEALRKAAQNPVASLISVPIQENLNFNIGPADRTQNVLNIQPVIPVNVGENWNLIIRWITPIIYQPYAVSVPQPPGPPVQVQTGVYGFGDMQPAFFLSPKKGKIIWGVGPQFLVPTATRTGILGQGKFGIGPTAVVLVQPGKWTLGTLASNVWGVAGHPELPDVNQFLLQYFINYNLPKGYYLTWQPTLTANWEATNGGRWVVPLGGGIGRIMRLGFQPVNIGFNFTETLCTRPVDPLGACGCKSRSYSPKSRGSGNAKIFAGRICGEICFGLNYLATLRFKQEKGSYEQI
jgi:hypothetical protein